MDTPWNRLPDITLLIRQTRAGDRFAEGRLFRLAYPYLTAIASRLMRRTGFRRADAPQELVHDVYVTRLEGWPREITDRGHFLALATLAMKNELIDRARRNMALKRSGGAGFPAQRAHALHYDDIMLLEGQIENLARLDPRAAQVLRLRYYGGCSWAETAAATGATVKMVRNDWEFAAKWLAERLRPAS